MAIGWLSLLKTVPWADVISTAPVVADGAKKLWNAVAGKPAQVAAPPEPAAAEPGGDAIAQVRARLAGIEAKTAELHAQMLASSELIKTLAEQNAELIKRVEANRIRLLWLTGVVVLVAVLAGLALVLEP